jgi:hypothetical protein
MNLRKPANGDSAAPGSSSLLFESIWRDIRFAVRSLLKSPGFAVVAILVIGVGIGAIPPSSPLLIPFCSSRSLILIRHRW